MYSAGMTKKRLPHMFWSGVSPMQCWTWNGPFDRNGYGRTSDGQRPMYAHRLAWEQVNGPIPDGLYVLHRCNNPPCVRPDHLYLGTALDNAIDRRGNRRPHRANYKLSRAEVEDIRRRYATGTVRQQTLAEEYGVIQTTISKIVRGQSYRFDVAPRANARR